jgi:hypothetical protein
VIVDIENAKTVARRHITSRDTPPPPEPKPGQREGADRAAARSDGMVLIQLPNGPKFLFPAMARAVNQDPGAAESTRRRHERSIWIRRPLRD